MASSNYQKKDGRKVPILGRPKIGTSIFFFFKFAFCIYDTEKYIYIYISTDIGTKNLVPNLGQFFFT